MRFRAALHLALWFLLVSALAGCASLPFQSDPTQDTPVEPKQRRSSGWTWMRPPT